MNIIIGGNCVSFVWNLFQRYMIYPLSIVSSKVINVCTRVMEYCIAIMAKCTNNGIHWIYITVMARMTGVVAKISTYVVCRYLGKPITPCLLFCEMGPIIL
jgi:hypothetical protein